MRPTARPGSTHDLTAARVTGFLGALHAAALLGLPALAALAALADKGYDGAGAGVLTPTKGGNLHPDNLTRNLLLDCLRAQGERGIALLKTRWKALNRIRLCPQRIGAIAKAALVLTTAERPIR
jgi:DDE superfamily endonuclease